MRKKQRLRIKGPIIGLTTGLAILVSSTGAFAQTAGQSDQAAEQAAPTAATAPAAPAAAAEAAAPAAAAPAAAPTEAAAPAEEMESVVVRGTRASQQASMTRKKNAPTAMDSIS